MDFQIDYQIVEMDQRIDGMLLQIGGMVHRLQNHRVQNHRVQSHRTELWKQNFSFNFFKQIQLYFWIVHCGSATGTAMLTANNATKHKAIATYKIKRFSSKFVIYSQTENTNFRHFEKENHVI